MIGFIYLAGIGRSVQYYRRATNEFHFVTPVRTVLLPMDVLIHSRYRTIYFLSLVICFLRVY
jgi:hypothetical protein